MIIIINAVHLRDICCEISDIYVDEGGYVIRVDIRVENTDDGLGCFIWNWVY